MNAHEIALSHSQIKCCLDADCSSARDWSRIPFAHSLSLKPLIDHWRSNRWYEEKPFLRELGRQLKERLEEVPVLESESLSLDQVHEHQDIVDGLFTVIFPAVARDDDLYAAFAPFTGEAFYASAEYRRWVPDDRDAPKANLDEQTYAYLRILFGYSAILRRFYDIHLGLEYPVIRTAKDPDTGMDFHFQAEINPQFISIRALNPPPRLSKPDLELLKSNLTDLNVLTRLIPPEGFLFYGFNLANIVDVTDSEILSAMKRLLMDRNALLEPDRFKELQGKMNVLLRRSRVRMALMMVHEGQAWTVDAEGASASDCVFQNTAPSPMCDMENTVAGRSIREGRPLLIEDLNRLDSPGEYERGLLKRGQVNLAAAPLFYEREAIGVLMFTSSEPGDLNAVNAMKLREVTPLFAGALKRTMGEIGNQVQAVIKRQCTAIHPSVEWRFRRAAIQALREAPAGAPAEMEPIVFREVYPLYGVSDIRNSSSQRNAAIQEDMKTHLGMVRQILLEARAAKPMEILDELLYRQELQERQAQDGLTAEGEFKALDFIRNEIEPVLKELASFTPGLNERIKNYHDALNAEHRTIYEKRRDYDQSVQILNQHIAQLWDREQASIQEVYPHYFEKHTSDGLDHSIYAGRALNPEGKFDPLYLRNLRLWQLLTMSRAARRCAELRQELPVPLETAHLIAVQTSPLNIRFRYDEKKFDVEGAYDVRYEILKKRIDKAWIKGGRERLTQPGKIAVVYTHGREGSEYRRYVDYLVRAGHAEAGVEELELQDLQGIQGLKALRFSVRMEGGDKTPDLQDMRRYAEDVVSMSG